MIFLLILLLLIYFFNISIYSLILYCIQIFINFNCYVSNLLFQYIVGFINFISLFVSVYYDYSKFIDICNFKKFHKQYVVERLVNMGVDLTS
jgi:hypothetical protein